MSAMSNYLYLPFHIGDTVYTTYGNSLSHYKVVEFVINDFVWVRLRNDEYCDEHKTEYICLDFSLGRYVFATEEEARKKLKLEGDRRRQKNEQINN